jgi:mycothiol synthase
MMYEPLRPESIEIFCQFCRRHRSRLDDSYITESELATLTPSQANPTWMALEAGSVIAAASLVMDDYHVRGRRARFRVLFSDRPETGIYRGLLNNLQPAAAEIDYWFLFVKDENLDQMRCVVELGFRIERSSHILLRGALPAGPVQFPDGVLIRTFVSGQDEATYANVRNKAFAPLMGSQTPITVDHVANMVSDASSPPVGIFLLEADGQVVGIVCTGKDPGDDGEVPSLEIGPLAVLPEYQGRGYGTLLLRYALRFGQEQAGLSQAVLSVNAENTPALGLYLREGFKVIQGLTCMRQDI